MLLSGEGDFPRGRVRPRRGSCARTLR